MDRPILFSGPMVRAILAGKKTQTRRLLGLDTFGGSATPGYDWTWRGQAPIRSIAQQRRYPHGCWQDVRDADLVRLCPYGVPGDRLWVRETWYCDDFRAEGKGIHRADENAKMRAQFLSEMHFRAEHECRDWEAGCPCADEQGRGAWRPSIFMPRWASRLSLAVESVRVERLHAITEADALAEGMTYEGDELTKPTNFDGVRWEPIGARLKFTTLWDSINGKRAPWASNPWVWVVTFSVAS